YLGGMWILLLTIWQTMVGWEYTATIGDLARFGLISFRILAYVQLMLLLFFAALSAAGAVSLEKDRRTFLLRLLTRLRNDEIVLGKLFGSLMQIGLMLLGSIPLLALLMILGGIEPFQIAETVLVLGTTALAAGSLSGLVALWRDKTFQSLALTVLFLVLYLCLVEALPLLAQLLRSFSALAPYFDVATAREWQEALNPFRALTLVVDPARYPEQDWWSALNPFHLQTLILDPARYFQELSAAQRFAIVMLTLTVLLNGLGILRLRVGTPSGEPIMQREVVGATPAEPDRIHAAPGKVRPVWANPILWREIASRAYGRRPLLVQAAYFVVLGLVCYYALVAMEPRAWTAAYGLVPIGILSLLLISAQSVTSITSERDLGSLDLLVITDLSPKEFLFGKIFGILSNINEYILPPLILVVIYAIRGQLGSPPRGESGVSAGKNIEAAFYLAIALLILIAFTIMLGI